ncbi:hypothetical protein F5Y00DRAFT_272703 [Daldinia vernicosa]|uniref:uncharacterized protein n=1 Tax=Daldinia vernicosa TaxID=114800 RepID=UPI0020074D42|nr:uncharacterized protein F5Y00DRAFT_272703 [Daldinia vernicosa]KAI0845797.1 hypothetical protein F5Y00DRAFT_272703 [Daldinia vernicosa]
MPDYLSNLNPDALGIDEFASRLDELDNIAEYQPNGSQLHDESAGNHQFKFDCATTLSIPMISEPYLRLSITNLEEHGTFEAPREPATRLEQSLHPGSCKADPVTPEHHPVLGPSKFSCIQCNTSFETHAELSNHALVSQHNPVACSCGERFSRPDALNRHCNSFRKDNRSYPCNFCKRHRGRKAFGRRDHLVQHLRGYHKFDQEEIDKSCPKYLFSRQRYHQILVCPYAECEYHRGEEFKSSTWSRFTTDAPFKNQSDYKQHLKDVHEDTPFPCHVDGCDRVGRRGYMRERDLMKHLTSQHPDAAEYSPAPREKTVYECCDCGRRYTSATGFKYHHCRPDSKEN